MKKTLVILVTLLLNLTTSISYASEEQSKREDVLEDAVIDLLQPQMYQAVQKKFGTTREIAFQCLKVVDIKKVDHSGSWLFEATLEGMTYTGAHNPPNYIFTVTVIKDWKTEGKWVMKEYKVRTRGKEIYNCRRPA